MTSYLGLDASTQSLTALLIDVHTGAVRANHSVVFGERLPRYQSPKGFLAHQDRRVVHSDPLMWVEALELVLGDLVEAGVNLGDVAGVSGAGQQHGSVYLARSFEDVGSWSLDRPLRDQVAPRLSRRTAPGQFHQRRVRRNHRSRWRRRSTRGDQRLARHRALHRPADPEILQGRARRLGAHARDSSGELVHGVAAHRFERTD
jgi:hypothetical protein